MYEIIDNVETKKKAKRRCPCCGKEVDIKTNPFRPFCSKRCKMTDLGSWLRGEYSISSSIYPPEPGMEERGRAE